MLHSLEVKRAKKVSFLDHRALSKKVLGPKCGRRRPNKFGTVMFLNSSFIRRVRGSEPDNRERRRDEELLRKAYTQHEQEESAFKVKQDIINTGK